MTQESRSLLTRLTFVATLGGLLFGYDTAVISGAVGAIDANFIEPLNLSETARGSLSGWTVSSALFGCIIGAVIAGWVAKRLGRKGGLLIAGEPLGADNQIWFRLLVAFDVIFTILSLALVETVLVG